MNFLSSFFRPNTLDRLDAMDDRRLSDLGLTRHDIARARGMGHRASAFLSARRDERAATWLR